MRIEQLKHIIVVSRCSSLSLAAESMHMSVQSLSNSILSLENEMGIKILDRSNHGVSLTKEGQALLHFSQQTLSNYEELMQEFHQKPLPVAPISSKSEEITVYSVPAFINPTVSNIVNSFLKDHSDVAINLCQMPYPDVCSKLQKTDKPAVGLIVVPYQKRHYMRPYIQNDRFAFQPMAVTQYACCIPRNSPLLAPHAASIHTLLTYPIVFYSAGDVSQSPLYHILKKYKQDLQFSIITSSHDYWTQSIKNGMGIGFVNKDLPISKNLLLPSYNDLIMIRIKEPLLAISGVLYKKNSSKAVKDFVEQLPKYVALKGDPRVEEPF